MLIIFKKERIYRKISSNKANIYLIKVNSRNFYCHKASYLTPLGRRSLSYRKQSIDLQSKSIDWFLYDKDPLHKTSKCPLYRQVLLELHAFHLQCCLRAGFLTEFRRSLKFSKTLVDKYIQ